VNVLVVGSLIVEPGAPSPAIVVPGFMLATVGVVLLGHAIGRSLRPADDGATGGPNWLMWLAVDAFAATALVVTAGGLVTGFDAGFAVPDWPTSFEANMFLFPLSKMTGGIYYEHAHRLAGTLVGLTAIALMARVVLERGLGRSIKVIAVAAFILVCLQGVAGGLWVTDVAKDEAAARGGAAAAGEAGVRAAPSLGYILFHGTFGQVILAGFGVLAAMLSRRWRSRQAGELQASASTDRMIAATLVGLMLVQLFIGVYLRKADGLLFLHITVAGLVSLLAVAVGVRLWGVHGDRQPTLRRLGLGLLWLVLLQLVLGLTAMIVRRPADSRTVEIGTTEVAPAVDALVTTLHQSVGAALLTVTALAAAWSYRLLKPTPQAHPSPSVARAAGSGG
jgi:cytochrome c oxidase assembly protein subunit 15